MNDIVKNTDLFIDILSMSRTSAIQKWDKEAFQRAFRWAQFFQHVHRKTKGKPNIAEKISQHLATACSRVDTKLGLTSLKYEDLPLSSCILRKNLLENPYLNNEFYLQLVGQLQTNEKEEYKKQLNTLSKLKAILQILQLIQKRFVRNPRSTLEEKCEGVEENEKKGVDDISLSVTKGRIKANAILLRKCISNVIAGDYQLFEGKKVQLHAKLGSMIKHKRGLDVLITALSCDEDEDVSRYIMDFIEDMLIPKWKLDWKQFLQLPFPHLFGHCSVLYARFYEMYLDMLKFCGDCLQEDVTKLDYVLIMERCDGGAKEQLYKHYYNLLRNVLQILLHMGPENELKVEAFVKEACTSCTDESNVWRKLLRDLFPSSEN